MTAFFLRRIAAAPTGCWEWTGKRTSRGYGQIPVGTSSIYAHRFSYEYFVGPIPSGLQIDHLCRNPGCVNPTHLEPVTNRENAKRGLKGRQTHCQSGHLFNDANTRLVEGRRNCRMCQRYRRMAKYPNALRQLALVTV